jgi:Response regulator of the LytR/AlgR family
MDYKNKVKIAICDDENLFLNHIQDLARRILHEKEGFDYEIKVFNRELELLETEIEYQIVVLDIEMPQIDGFEVAKKLKEKYKRSPIIIFVTSHSELMNKGYYVRAFRYLVKPIVREQLEEALGEAIRELLEIDTIIIEADRKKYIISISDIMYIEALGEGCCLHIGDMRIIRKEPLKYWICTLTQNVIIQVHKSYIVNIGYIKSIANNEMSLSNGDIIPISVRRKKYVKDKLYEYMEKGR